MNYDPNLTNSGRTAKQTVKLTFGKWEYRAERTVEVGGNCTGLSVIESAIDRVLEELDQHGERMIPEIVLTSPNGDQLECSDDDETWDEWLKDMLVGAEIIAIRPDRDLFAEARARKAPQTENS